MPINSKLIPRGERAVSRVHSYKPTLANSDNLGRCSQFVLPIRAARVHHGGRLGDVENEWQLGPVFTSPLGGQQYRFHTLLLARLHCEHNVNEVGT